MSITISCPHCSHKVKVPETKWAEITGKKVRCKGCKEPFELSDDCVVRTLDNSAQKAQPKPEPIKEDDAKEGENVETADKANDTDSTEKSSEWKTYVGIALFFGIPLLIAQFSGARLYDPDMFRWSAETPRPAASRPVASRPAAPRPVASRPVASRPVASRPAAAQPAAPRQQYFDRDGELKKAAYSEAERMNNKIKQIAEMQRINVVDQYNDFYSELYRRLDAETVGLSGDAFKTKCGIICDKWRLQQIQDKLR